MANTTNFGWETPDDTDLVKDGAAAMRTLGNAIDTSLVDLKGGTTGQVLSKTSNTDMDFTWVTSDDANAIQNAIVDAKGDLISATAADTPARLAVGNNGETLVADSSTSTGLRWQEPKAGNPVINSAFQVWQRGTSIATTSYPYTADRWISGRAGGVGGGTVSRQTTGDTTNLPNIQYCARVQRDSGNTSTATSNFGQPFETVNSIPFAGKTVTLSFYARKGANFSGTSDQIQVYLVTGTGTDQNGITSTYTGSVNAINGQNATLTTTWQRFSFTATLNSDITEMNITFNAGYTGTAGAADYYEITGVQLEVGSVATPFKTQGVTLAGELAACQRYYQKSYSQATTPPTNSTTAGLVFLPTGNQNVANGAYISPVRFPVVMRGAPTVTIYSYTSSTTGAVSNGSGTDLAANSGGVTAVGDAGFAIYNNSGGAITAANGGFVCHYIASLEL